MESAKSEVFVASIKTVSAIIGTTGGVLVAGLLAYIYGTAAQLTGFSDEEMYTLLYIPQQVNFNYKGLLFAGMIIGALGAVKDVGMSIASAVDEIKKANPLLKSGQLIKAGMNVGRECKKAGAPPVSYFFNKLKTKVENCQPASPTKAFS